MFFAQRSYGQHYDVRDVPTNQTVLRLVGKLEKKECVADERKGHAE
jgi:hypothetical protein